MNLVTNRQVIQTKLKNVQQNINKFSIGKDNHERVLLPVLEDIFKTSIRVVVFVKVYNIKG